MEKRHVCVFNKMRRKNKSALHKFRVKKSNGGELQMFHERKEIERELIKLNRQYFLQQKKQMLAKVALLKCLIRTT